LKTSIAIAVKNGENFLEATLESIPSWVPIILSDNHSSDNTASICKKFDNVTYFKPREQLSMLENWDYVTSKVTTEYFRLVGHDDLVNPDSILDHESYLDKNKKAVFVRSKRKILLQSKIFGLVSISTPQPGREISTAADIVKAVALSGTNIIGEPFTSTIRTSDFINHLGNWGGDRFGMCELNTWTRLARLGEVGYSEIDAGQFRVHSKSYSASLGSPFNQARVIRYWTLDQRESENLNMVHKVRMHLNGRLRALARSFVHMS
jgi:glycosyltransferase involved in cell wall biosynthesis